jgi:membrane peptidoglycan carboxypeptidase
VFVWIGKSSNDTEKKFALETAEKYVQAARDGRDSNTPVILVHSGSEPPMFSAAFLGWDHEKAKTFEDPYEKKLRELSLRETKHEEPAHQVQLKHASPVKVAPAQAAAASPLTSKPKPEPAPASTSQSAPQSAPQTAPQSAPQSATFLDPTTNSFPLDQLRTDKSLNVDPVRKEQYLSDADFKTVFKMDKAAFSQQKAWRQEQLKRDVKLW